MCIRDRILDRKTETLDRQPAIVVQGVQCLEHFFPCHMPGSGDAAIVFAGMNVLEVGADDPITGRNILFFDVGVEGVKENADVRMANLFGEHRSIGGGVEKVGFKTVQRFDGKGHTVGGDVYKRQDLC